MNEASIGVACRAEVPIWAIEALVSNTVDVLVTSIADSIVTNVATRSKEILGNKLKVGFLNSRLEGMLWVVAMLHSDVAIKAQIKVWASSAGNKVILGVY